MNAPGKYAPFPNSAKISPKLIAHPNLALNLYRLSLSLSTAQTGELRSIHIFLRVAPKERVRPTGGDDCVSPLSSLNASRLCSPNSVNASRFCELLSILRQEATDFKDRRSEIVTWFKPPLGFLTVYPLSFSGGLHSI